MFFHASLSDERNERLSASHPICETNSKILKAFRIFPINDQMGSCLSSENSPVVCLVFQVYIVKLFNQSKDSFHSTAYKYSYSFTKYIYSKPSVLQARFLISFSFLLFFFWLSHTYHCGYHVFNMIIKSTRSFFSPDINTRYSNEPSQGTRINRGTERFLWLSRWNASL